VSCCLPIAVRELMREGSGRDRLDVTERAAEEILTRGETAPYEKQLIRKDGSCDMAPSRSHPLVRSRSSLTAQEQWSQTLSEPRKALAA
jgi:hypothetical protein